MLPWKFAEASVEVVEAPTELVDALMDVNILLPKLSLTHSLTRKAYVETSRTLMEVSTISMEASVENFQYFHLMEASTEAVSMENFL